LEALERDLAAFERGGASDASGNTAAQIELLSEELVKAGTKPGFPSYQISRWVWVASQYRLHKDETGPIKSESAARTSLFVRSTSPF